MCVVSPGINEVSSHLIRAKFFSYTNNIIDSSEIHTAINLIKYTNKCGVISYLCVQIYTHIQLIPYV